MKIWRAGKFSDLSDCTISAKLICSQINSVGGISGITGLPGVVHLPEFTEFCKGIGGNVVFVVALGSVIHILNRITKYYFQLFFEKAKFSCAKKVLIPQKLNFTAVKLS